PGTGHASHIRLPAQLSFGTNLTSHTRHFRSECVELIHHHIDHFFDLKDLASHIYGDLLGQVTVGDSRCDFGHIAELHGKVTGHEVDVIGQILPRTGKVCH